jgi:hypothetical protein
VLILLDNNTPRGVARALTGHTVTEARERGWATLKNGELLTVAEEAGFDVLVTSDKSIRYQQNLEGRKIALVVLTIGAGGLYVGCWLKSPPPWTQPRRAPMPRWKSLTSNFLRSTKGQFCIIARRPVNTGLARYRAVLSARQIRLSA